MIHPLIQENRKELSKLCEQHYIKKLYVFGSITKNDFTEKKQTRFNFYLTLERIM